VGTTAQPTSTDDHDLDAATDEELLSLLDDELETS